MKEERLTLDGEKLGIALGALLFFGGFVVASYASETLGVIMSASLFVMWPILKLFKKESK